jgi:hypothetical protein
LELSLHLDRPREPIVEDAEDVDAGGPYYHGSVAPLGIGDYLLPRCARENPEIWPAHAVVEVNSASTSTAKQIALGIRLIADQDKVFVTTYTSAVVHAAHAMLAVEGQVGKVFRVEPEGLRIVTRAGGCRTLGQTYCDRARVVEVLTPTAAEFEDAYPILTSKVFRDLSLTHPVACAIREGAKIDAANAALGTLVGIVQMLAALKPANSQ